MPVHVGTSGWSYPSGRGTWNGVFYAARRRKGFDELAYYAEHFDSVEVNSTFYRQPDPVVTRSWLARTPTRFTFAAKLYQKFTHPDMYLGRNSVANWDVTQGDLDEFRRGIDPIAQSGRLLALLVQFPPSFHADTATEAYMEWLTGQLAAYPVAVELRHRSWSDKAPETRSMLRANLAAWVHIDEPKFDDSIRQSLDTLSEHDPLVYLRFHGRNTAAWWTHDAAEDRYNYLYQAAELAPVAGRAEELSQRGAKVVAYFNNHFSAKAVANAAILKHQLGDLVPGDYPRDMIERYPELADIVTTSGLPL